MKKKETFDKLWKELSEDEMVEHYEANWSDQGFIDAGIRFKDGSEIYVNYSMTVDEMIQRANEMIDIRKGNCFSK